MKKNLKEKYKFLVVLVFFLVSGVIYSHSFYSGGLEMGTKIAAEEFAVPSKAPVVAETMMGKININTATAEELTLLSGIGETRAEDIIIYREQNEGFHQIEDIMKVSGIGEKTFDEIKEQITVGE